jgi:DNA-binding transcriptional ArsR family regulator
MSRIPAGERLAGMLGPGDMEPAVRQLLDGVTKRGSWGEAELQRLMRHMVEHYGAPPEREETVAVLNWWVDPVAFGQGYLAALTAYRDAYFAEEERRITPALEEALAQAQALAGRLSLPELLEELSQGIRYAEPPGVDELILAPSFWVTPLIVREKLAPGRELLLFGARPANASLVPGEVVPDALFRALKALADPTRLRILRYLAAEPLSPAQLSRRLRLRAPTVVHHLHTLRLAGLVYLSFEAGDRRYAARIQAVEATFIALQRFLLEKEEEPAGG